MVSVARTIKNPPGLPLGDADANPKQASHRHAMKEGEFEEFPVPYEAPAPRCACAICQEVRHREVCGDDYDTRQKKKARRLRRVAQNPDAEEIEHEEDEDA